MFTRLFLGMGLAVGLMGTASIAAANISPTLLIESGPSDNPEYRRMIFVKYLAGDRVNVNYKTYSRSEFKQVPNTTPSDVISACARGSATSLSDIRAFEKAESKRARRGEAPEVMRFCIKNVSNWDASNRDSYLDPIFNGLPLAPKVN